MDKGRDMLYGNWRMSRDRWHFRRCLDFGRGTRDLFRYFRLLCFENWLTEYLRMETMKSEFQKCK